MQIYSNNRHNANQKCFIGGFMSSGFNTTLIQPCNQEKRQRKKHVLTFCHKDSREARLEHAATNQQLPSCPWCRSCALMPSTNRWGSSHSSYTPRERQKHLWNTLHSQYMSKTLAGTHTIIYMCLKKKNFNGGKKSKLLFWGWNASKMRFLVNKLCVQPTVQGTEVHK